MSFVQIEITRSAMREPKARLIHVVIEEIDEQDRGFEELPTEVWKRTRSARP